MAIVGTRGPSIYGHKVTSELATELVTHGWAITSGLALGVMALPIMLLLQSILLRCILELIIFIRVAIEA